MFVLFWAHEIMMLTAHGVNDTRNEIEMIRTT